MDLLALILALTALGALGYGYHAFKIAEGQIQAQFKAAQEEAKRAVVGEVNRLVLELRTGFEADVRQKIERAIADATMATTDAMDEQKDALVKQLLEMIGQAAKGIEQEVDRKIAALFAGDPGGVQVVPATHTGGPTLA